MKTKRSAADYVFETFLFIFITIVVISTLYPFLNVLAISFNESSDAVKGGITIFPRKFTLNNYMEILKYKNLVQGFYISVLRTAVGVATGIFATACMAYTISRPDFLFKKSFTIFFLITLYISGGLIPEYMVIKSVGLVNSFWVYIIPGLIQAYNLLLIKSFMEDLPYSLQESAKIDGANDVLIFFRIVLPLCLPVIATICLFIAVAQWNSWTDTYIYAPNNEKLTTLQFELMKIMESSKAAAQQAATQRDGMASQSSSVSPLSIRMAITIISTVPILLVYPFIQKYFVKGLTLGAVKS